MPCLRESDDLEDWEDPEPPDEDEDDDPTVPCPACGASIHDESEWCPSCGVYLEREMVARAGRPWWFVVGAFLCLLVMLRLVLR